MCQGDGILYSDLFTILGLWVLGLAVTISMGPAVILSVQNTIFHDQSAIPLFVFVALRPMSTAMVIAGRSVHLTTLFPGQA